MNTESYSYEKSLEEERDFWRDVAHIIKEDVACLSCHVGEGHRGPDGEKYECPLDLVPDTQSELLLTQEEAEGTAESLTGQEKLDLEQLYKDRASALYELTQTGWGDSSTIMFVSNKVPEDIKKPKDKATL